MGECADDIITTLRVNEETASYTDVRAALNGYFAARRNTIVERARFNTRKQTPEESVGTFIQDLYRIAEDCEYGTLKNQVIRDRIVVGALDDALSDRLQAKSDLTLADAVRMSREAKPRKQSCEEKRSPAMLRSLATLITSISPYQATLKAIVAKLQIPRNQTHNNNNNIYYLYCAFSIKYSKAHHNNN